MEIKEGFCFLTQEEANSWNRVHRAPGARVPDRKDEDKVSRILEICDNLEIIKIRSAAGVKLWKSEE